MPAIGHGTEICTSTTRPSTAPEGLMIYETDTNKVLVNSSATSTPSWVEAHDLDNTGALSDAALNLSPSSLVTSLPSSPVNGQVIYYQADATNGVIWQLRYNSASASSYKWEFIGGSPIVAYQDAGQTWNYVGEYGGGPTVILTPALSGDYVVDFSAGLGGSSGQLQVVGVKVKFNGSDINGNQADYQAWTTQVSGISQCKTVIRTGHTGGTNMQLFGTTNWAGASINRRYLAARPIRVG